MNKKILSYILKVILIILIGLLFVLIVVSLLYSASAIQVTCDYEKSGEAGGIKVWSNLNLTESHFIGNIFENLSEQLNCTLSSETNLTEIECKKYFAPVINILNSNIDERNKTIRNDKIFMFISTILFVLLFIREIFLRRKK